MSTSSNSPTTFKRLPIGSRFASRGANYRKVSERGAFKLLPSGRGQVHAQVTFSRSTAVTVL
jgi:hypothetical protein